MLLQFTKFANLLLQFLDITFLALTECSLLEPGLANSSPRAQYEWTYKSM